MIRTLNYLGLTGLLADHYSEAHAALQRGLSLAVAQGDRRGMALCHGNLSLVVCRLGQIDEAHEHVLAALALYTELEDGWGVIRSLSYLGRIALAQNTMAGPKQFSPPPSSKHGRSGRRLCSSSR